MTRRLTVLFAAVEALLAVAIGVAIPLVPLVIVWGLHLGFAPEPVAIWRGAADSWLIGHGVDVTFVLPPDVVEALALPGADAPIRVTLAALGFALITLLLGARAGGRITETGHPLLGGLVGLGVFGGLSVLVTLSAVHPDARPSIWQGVLLPTLVFAAGLLFGSIRAGGIVANGPSSARLDELPASVRVGLTGALRAGAASVVLVLVISAVAVTVLIAVHFAELLRLYESLHAEVVGGLAVTAAQLALLPDAVIWTASWFAGPGFALGTGSHVSPLGTAVGPVPAIPLLAAVPTGDSAFGFVGLLVPVLAGFVSALVLRPALARRLDGALPLPVAAGIAVGGAVTGGLLLGLLAAAASGAAGPGRLAEVGPDALAVGLATALELLIGLALGLVAASVGRGRR